MSVCLSVCPSVLSLQLLLSFRYKSLQHVTVSLGLCSNVIVIVLCVTCCPFKKTLAFIDVPCVFLVKYIGEYVVVNLARAHLLVDQALLLALLTTAH